MASNKQRAIKELKLVVKEFDGRPVAKQASALEHLLASDDPDTAKLQRHLRSFANAAALYIPPQRQRTGASIGKRITKGAAAKKARKPKIKPKSSPRYHNQVFMCLEDYQTCCNAGTNKVACVSVCVICIMNQMKAAGIITGVAAATKVALAFGPHQ
jgi:hypothetical protein